MKRYKVLKIFCILLVTMFACRAYVLAIVIAVAFAEEEECIPSITTSSTYKSDGPICKGALIFEDNFDFWDSSKWKHEVSLFGGGNWEFQYYWEDPRSSWIDNGALTIHPGKLADVYGEEFLWSGTLDLGDRCTQPDYYGCYRVGSPDQYLNPATSAKVYTKDQFTFKFGTIEVRAKMPAGDWLWTALWMMPQAFVYGQWPISGEIDLTESRGNRDYYNNGEHIGNEMALSTLHWGTAQETNQFLRTQFKRNSSPGQGYDKDFHIYRMEWTTDHIKFTMDGEDLGFVAPPDGGFFEMGEYSGENPWAGGTKMAPFDEEFYIILCLAVGGTNGMFPDEAQNPGGKPWYNFQPDQHDEFWNGRWQWEPTWWNDGSENLVIDYVRVWAA